MSLKQQKLDADAHIHQHNVSGVEASLELTLQIAKQKRLASSDERFFTHAPQRFSRAGFGRSKRKKIQQVSLSNDTIKRRISCMSSDIKQQVRMKSNFQSCSLFHVSNQQISHHAHSFWVLCDAYMQKMSKLDFQLVQLWKLQTRLKMS